jgi:putative endonuclease
MAYYIYLVRCSDESLYTGYTKDIEARIKKHNSKYGAKSLRGKLPVSLVHQESFITKSEALKREVEIKSWPKKKKEALIQVA